MERRRHPRLYEPFPAIVRGVGENGDPFEVPAVLDNFSAGGFYARLRKPLKQEEEISAIVRLTTNQSAEASGPRVAIEGIVVRAEPQSDGMQGIAVRFTSHRFL